MSCPKTILLSIYLDNELQGDDKTALEEHLRGCAACKAAYAELQALRSAFAHRESYQAPYGFAARVMAKTARLEGKRSSRFVPVIMRFAEAAVLLLVITVGILAGTIMMNGSSSEKVPNMVSSFSLDLFEATPPGSLGGTYLAMTEVRYEN